MSAFVFQFGKHAGQPITDVPKDYLQFLFTKNREMNALIERELERRRMLEEDQMPLVEKLVHAGYKALARSAHPDVGGTDDQFKALQAAYEQLKAAVKAVR